MNFKYEVETKIGVATPTSPKSTDIVLTPGKVEQLSLTFPAGCSGLVGLRILRGSFQLWPLMGANWFIADDFTIVLPESVEIRNGEDRFRIESYNSDTKYDHTVHVQFTVSLPDTVTERTLQVLTERLPVGLDGLVSAITEIQEGTGQSIEIMRDELIPILQASLQAQQKLLERSYSDMSLKELLDF